MQGRPAGFMAEVSGCLRSGAHKLSAFITLRTHHHLSAADSRGVCPCSDEFVSAASSSSSAEVLTCDQPAVSVWTDRTHGMNKQTQLRPQVRGYCALLLLPRKHSRLRAALLGTRAYSWRTEQISTALHRSRTAYYDILKVSPNATQAQIKSAYYKQSFVNHPDRNRSADAARLFALVAEAYSVLGNSGLRRKYDRGILSQTDLQNAGRPPSSTAPDAQNQPRRAADANAHFHFDAFYQAHYGEQLQREKQMRNRREQLRRQQQDKLLKWKLMKMNEVTVGVLLLFGGVLLISLRS